MFKDKGAAMHGPNDLRSESYRYDKRINPMANENGMKKHKGYSMGTNGY